MAETHLDRKFGGMCLNKMLIYLGTFQYRIDEPCSILDPACSFIAIASSLVTVSACIIFPLRYMDSDVKVLRDSHINIPCSVASMVMVLKAEYGDGWLAWLLEVCNHHLLVSLLA